MSDQRCEHCKEEPAAVAIRTEGLQRMLLCMGCAKLAVDTPELSDAARAALQEAIGDR